MDEPTAALSAAEAERPSGIIRDLRRSGVAVPYVSHRLDEILELRRRVTVPFSFIVAQRDGRNVLVDTGFMQDDHRSGFSRKFRIPTWI